MKNLLILIIAIFISGCATTSAMKFSKLSFGMSKEEVRNNLGNPYLFRAAKDGEEVWEYTVYAPAYPNANPWTGNIVYWVVFRDNKLTFYGHPGDFGTSGPDSKKEIIVKQR